MVIVIVCYRYLYFYDDENNGIQLTLSTYARHNVFIEHGRSNNDHHFRFLVDHSLIDTFRYQKGQRVKPQTYMTLLLFGWWFQWFPIFFFLTSKLGENEPI